MESLYHVTYDKNTHKDFNKIKRFSLNKLHYERIIEEINNDIEKLKHMPRIHKTLIYSKDKKGEYRRMVSGKYSIIYKIIQDEIIILRVFNQKENYLNQRKFILREESQSYFINRRRINMIKFRTLKNSYAKLKENFTHTITEEKYVSDILEKAVEKLNSGRAVFYTHEEFWKLVKEMEVEDYREEVSHNIRRRYA